MVIFRVDVRAHLGIPRLFFFPNWEPASYTQATPGSGSRGYHKPKMEDKPLSQGEVADE